MKYFIRFIGKLNTFLGKTFCFLILPLIGILCYEVISRYVFNAPTIWAHEISGHIFGAYAIIGGGYVLLHREHIKSDVLYALFSERAMAVVDLITYPFFFLLMGVIFYHGCKMAYTSVLYRETTVSFLRSPVYPVKLFIPAASMLMILQGIAQFVETLYGLFEKKV